MRRKRSRGREGLRWWIQDCPLCGARDGVHLKRTVGNAFRIVADVVAISLALGLGFLIDDLPWANLPLNYDLRCCHCGFHFAGRDGYIDRRHCPRCDYDLRGSPSGRCPECGWFPPVH